jgi:DNA-binding transcriptional ArsR family regulator
MVVHPLDALGDPRRREVLTLLGEGGRAVHEIAAELPISRPAVSRHLRILKESGLVVERTEGTRHIYELAVDGAAAVQDYLGLVWGEAATRFQLLAENTRPGKKP